MCGIAGLLAADPARFGPRMDASLASMVERGPDGQRMVQHGSCLLGQTRLAIIDLSERGQEPFENEDGSRWLTFNGEIYNHLDLRSELEMAGHRFRSQTDAEVVLHGFEEWGESVLNRLRGMFAFGLWDGRSQRLFLARDRLGKKPLFYSATSEGFFFASSAQALLALIGTVPAPDPNAIDHYLSWGYIPAPLSGFAGVRKLEPGSYLFARPHDSSESLRSVRYWNLGYEPKLDLTVEDACERVRQLTEEAVRVRLHSDVPLGAFLSGGIDSTIVTSLMAQMTSDRLKTFTIAFDDRSFDESRHARRVAEMLGTDHHEFVVEPDALEVLPDLVSAYGEPYADSSAIPTYYLARLAKDHVTVALNGDGGDEGFGGYERYWAAQVAARLDGIPGGRLAARAAALLPDSDDPKSTLRKVRRFAEAMKLSPVARYKRWTGYFTDEEKSRLYPRERFEPATTEEWFESLFHSAQGLDAADVAMSVDVQSYLPYDLLVKVDVASMLHSLECRSPLLDHHLLEFAARLPTSMKIRGATRKFLLRKAFQDALPTQNVKRPKMGFAVPIGRWLRGPLRPLVHDTLLSQTARVGAYLDQDEVASVMAAHERGAERSAQVWNLLMLELWLREVAEAAPVAAG